jgi:hypothetical protein
MRPNCRWTRAGVVMSGLALAGYLALVSTPAAAQETTAVSDTTPLTLLLVVFPDTTAAQNAMANLSSAGGPSNPAPAENGAGAPPNTVGNPANVSWIEPYYAVATKDKNGKVKVQHYGTKGTTARDTRAENSIDGVTAMLGERSNQSDKTGAAGAGASRAGISSSDMSEMQNALTPGNTALIIVVAHPDVANATSDLKQANASQVYDAPLSQPAQ